MAKSVRKFLGRVGKDERGLTAVEYAVLGGIVVAALIAVGTTFQTNLTGAFDSLFDKTTEATGS
ncbi:Flp family type IVb pilin [Novosphingobium resinovorum]|uniref:Flp family type IVb pilin n=1 Tax=Novosphingobium resinovorum TaxID=158500 RepID=UPI002ED5DF63|nr:Flp family type IVb pilin [Novosphingobium resinovorum]